MSQLFTGSICLTELIEKAKSFHSAFTKANNNKIYTNILIWQNDEPDKFGNTLSFQLNSSKEKKEAEGKIYIGNGKKMEAQAPQPLSNSDVSGLDVEAVAEPVKEPYSDLPF